MKIKVTLDGERDVADMLQSMREVVGTSTEEGIGIIGYYTGLRLANRIQPFGFSRLGKTEASVGKQVWRAVKNAQIDGSTQAVSSAHTARRNSKGQIPKDLTTAGKFKRKPYSLGEIEAHASEKMKNVGLAKASWVESCNNLGMGNIKASSEIDRHLGKGNGASRFYRFFFRTILELESKISYMRRLLKDRVITAALEMGRAAAYRYMDKNVTKALKQMTRTQKRAERQYTQFNKRAARLHALKTSI